MLQKGAVSRLATEVRCVQCDKSVLTYAAEIILCCCQDGHSALHIACEAGHEEVARVLLSHDTKNLNEVDSVSPSYFIKLTNLTYVALCR